MSTESQHNPYQPPRVDWLPPAVPDSDQRMAYSNAVKFIWDNPDWFSNLLFVMLCNLAGFIPVLPVLILYGYQAEILESLWVRPGQPYPSFRTNRLMDYLVRGVWPFLTALLVGLVLLPIFLVVLVLPILVLGLVVDAAEGRAQIAVSTFVPVLFCLAIAVGILGNLLLIPFLLRAALTQDIGASLDFPFALDFVGRMWKESILAGAFLILFALLAQIVGLLLLCVGVFLAIPVVQFTKVHLGYQLYRVYLSRGGREIPIKTAARTHGLSDSASSEAKP